MLMIDILTQWYSSSNTPWPLSMSSWLLTQRAMTQFYQPTIDSEARRNTSALLMTLNNGKGGGMDMHLLLLCLLILHLRPQTFILHIPFTGTSTTKPTQTSSKHPQQVSPQPSIADNHQTHPRPVWVAVLPKSALPRNQNVADSMAATPSLPRSATC